MAGLYVGIVKNITNKYMREIKFRVPILNQESEVWHWHYWGFINRKFKPRKNEWSGMKIGEDQQYTGLKDKNGKDIYEGDVIEYEDLALDGGGDGEKHIKVIKDLEDAVMFNMCFKYVGEKEREAIGNIYENPELLNI
jgi:hypothetical protein